jgi:hypothetical protein
MRVLAGFLVGLVLIFALPGFVLVAGREGMSAERALQLQASHPDAIFLRAFSSGIERYKLAAARRFRPVLLALGTSRMMQVQNAHFKEGTRFYNGSQGGEHLQDMRLFLEALEPAEPKVLLLGLDHFFFHPQLDYRKAYYQDPKEFKRCMESDESDLRCFQSSWTKVYKGLLQHSLSINDLLASRKRTKSIGIAALSRGEGFRADGSFQYGSQDAGGVSDPSNPDYGFKKTLTLIEKGTDRLEPGETVSPAALADLRELLSYCKQRGIHVVGFLTPFPHTIWVRLKESGRYGYMTSVFQAINPLFAEAGCTLADFSDMAVVGMDDSEAINGEHANARTYGIILKRLAAMDAKLAKYVME